MQKKVSLIIPCYNCEKTIIRCLRSVLIQNYKNLEIVCVNDGSVDKTKKIIEKIALRHKEIKSYNIENNGVSNARNFGLLQSSGELVMFLDSDDNYLKRNVIKKCVKKMTKKNADMVAFNFKHPCFQPYLKKGFYNLAKEKDFFRYYQDFFVSMMPWNKLMKRELITNNFDVNIHFAEDEIFNLENLKNFKRIYYIKKPYLNYFCDPKISKNSALHKTISEKNLCESQNTIWYKSNILFDIRENIINNNFPQKYQKEILYFRSFDFFFYEFQFMLNANISPYQMKKELYRIFHEERFLESLKLKEKNGLYIRSYNDEDLKELIDKFVEECCLYYKVNKKYKRMIVLLNLFAKTFCKANNLKKLNKVDILAKCLYNYEKDKSKEMKFINKVSIKQNKRRIYDK